MFARPNARVGGLIGVGSLMVLLWWWWPGLTNARPEVGLVVGGDVRTASEPLDRRLREEGLRTEWTSEPSDWCAVPDLLSELPERVDVVVVSVASATTATCDGGSTADLVDALRATGRRLVVVTATEIDALDPDAPLALALERTGVVVVEVDRLLAGLDEPVPCEWWDDCDESGTVVTIDVDGLTEAGTQRVARTIVAAVVGEDIG